ncbi:coniferyl aldehyde dehydrogenase [Rhodoblastus sphagnicola]|uniref:Aldehyde dehydrogenase n=1 Tax=Rhodoblastus sphagnicola TaxID=333368 RepID=A0A2S6N9W6_9HYPH|nr:coniferyl aldehyde dehydrogenase [Rhodoblastus sphagnicola]MBB4198769.1 acyl-CoA reductase-like NAD-dependent aldehyde dehydrogenase [Rhodoblastus sphagnicola]PPQ31404.1 coniferyl aldehyde dehydrogenase [Rhodoblastus sphagnicola]
MNEQSIAAILHRQREAFRAGPPNLAQRRETLKRLGHAVKASAEELAQAVSADFGHRSRHETLMADIFPVIAAARHARFHLRRWMRARTVWPGLELAPSRARIMAQPLGVVGVVSPWNYPVNLALTPLVAALAAGDRVMLKPSELTPRTAETLKEMLGGLFLEEEVAVVLGGPEVGAAFCALPFDALLFTGSTEVGRKVLAATAETLTPATLELGGKSPCVIAPGADLAQAAACIAVGKLLNAGQSCIAPDYVLLPAEIKPIFVKLFTETVNKLYPSLLDNADYTSVISDAHYMRLTRMVEEARQSGAEIVVIDPANENPPPSSRKFAPTLILDPSEDLCVMREEIFGPILPALGYQTFDSALDFVNARPRPLALYYFGPEDRNLRRLLAGAHAGGVTVNQTMSHFVAENLPFGGVGPSGMGAYHGEAGFRAFSHAKPVLLQSRLDSRILLRPPYGKLTEAVLRFMLRG